MLYDGAFGTRLFARGVELPNSALANKAHPDAVVEVHAEYIEAGSDLIETNTFVSSPLHLEMAGAGDVDAAGAEGKLLVAYPNAGLPELDGNTGETIFPHSPEEMARHQPDLLSAGAFVVGGCCGTGPEHIRAFRQVLAGRHLT